MSRKMYFDFSDDNVRKIFGDCGEFIDAVDDLHLELVDAGREDDADALETIAGELEASPDEEIALEFVNFLLSLKLSAAIREDFMERAFYECRANSLYKITQDGYKKV